MKKIFMMLALIGVFAVGQSKAQSTTQPDAATLSFIQQASLGGMKEVKAGKLATQKGKSLSVKAFGGRMVVDHTKANSKLMMIVKSKGWSVTPPTAAEIAPDAMLTGATGAAFDKNYVSMMVKDHEQTVALFENAAGTVTDPDVKAFAKNTLPTLKQHLASIKSIATKMNISTM